MVKFPSQRKMNFESGNTAAGVATTIGLLNVPLGLSVLNRRGYASTTRKGTPLIYRCRVDWHRVDESGNVLTNAATADVASTLTIEGCQNNWVMKNAAESYHKAREKAYRDAGILKKHRGAYAHEIRYNFDSASDAFLMPLDSTGTAFTGGVWDTSDITYEGDNAFELGLVGTGDDEHSDAFSGSYLSIGHSYLLSRVNQQSDTNLEMEEGPARYSVLRNMLDDKDNTATQGYVQEDARGEQDNPPYEVLDMSASGDTAHDITKEVELGRAVVGPGNMVGSCIVDIPFGICELNTYFEDAAATDTNQRAFISVEVLKISEMQG